MATILYIDQDEIGQKFIKATLGHQYNVVTVADGSTAIQYCAMIQPDLILIDVDQADVNAQELTSRLKMFMPQTPILALTGQVPNGSSAEGLPPTTDGFITKPVDEDKLWNSIYAFLPQPGSISQFVLAPGLLTDKMVEQLEAQIDALNQANKRLASLNTISALIGTSLDLEHLTDEILLQIHKTIDFDSATLFLLKGDILEAAASRGLPDFRQGMNVYHKSDKNSAWRVVQSKLPLIINDVTQSEYWEPRPELERVRSWLGVPLIYKERVVGVLTLDKNEPDGFIEADARFFFTLAHQMAIAVENAQLFEEWEDQATRLKLINEVSQEITTILDVDNLYDALAWAIFERLSYDRVAVYEVERPKRSAILRAYYSKTTPNPDSGPNRQLLNPTLVEQVIKTGRPEIVNVILGQTGNNAINGLENNQAHLLIPILIDSKVEAIINVNNDTPNRLGDQDLWTLSSLANHAATAIENARLYHNIDAYSEMLERTVVARTQRLQAIKRISQVVSQGLNVDELLALVGKEISQIFTPPEAGREIVKVVVGLVNGSRLTVRVVHSSQPADNLLEAIYKIDFQTPAGQVIKQSKPMIYDNQDMQSIFNAKVNLQSQTANSIMLAPLITAGKTIGLVIIERQKASAFDDSDLETLESVAYQVATAVEHARLLRKTRELAIVDERTRLARDMHDGVAQNLAYLLIQVDRCLNLVEEGSKLEAQLEQISAVLKQNIDELRRNIFDLRPVDLEGKSLFAVLENFVSEFGRRWNLKTNCRVQGDTANVSPEVESSLYRILQESLSNARKHAHCSQVWVELTVNSQTATLEVKDDGQGFNAGQAGDHFQRGKSKGLGLISMRERAEGVGGQLIVESQNGTRVFAELPLKTSTLETN